MTRYLPQLTILLTLACLAMTPACTKTRGDAYKAFMQGGELTYPGRPDTIIVGSAYKKIRLSVVLGSDPLVTKLKIFWNNGYDSTEASVNHSASGKDTAFVTLPDLAEGNYNFVGYTLDKDGNRSVPCYGSGVVYGESYLASVANRILRNVATSPDGEKIILSWGGASDGDIGTEVIYTGADGSQHKIVVPAGDATTTLPDYQGNSGLSYQTFYKPDPSAIETFSVPAQQVTLPMYERAFNKSNFKIVILPTDVLEGGYGWLMDMLWDESYNPPGFATQNKIPCWFTLDAGESASLARFKVWQANDRLYEKESVKTFELYGSNNPNSDGSWDSWTLVGSYTSTKPSGLPVGETTQADIDFANAGEEFTTAEGTPKFRYYRFKLLSNWGGGSFMTMEEITFYTHDRP